MVVYFLPFYSYFLKNLFQRSPGSQIDLNNIITDIQLIKQMVFWLFKDKIGGSHWFFRLDMLNAIESGFYEIPIYIDPVHFKAVDDTHLPSIPGM